MLTSAQRRWLVVPIAACLCLAVVVVLGGIALHLAGRSLFGPFGTAIGHLAHPLIIEGSVTDARTGGPVAGLEILPGSPIGEGFAWAAPERATRYALPIGRYRQEFRVPLDVVTRSDGGPVDVALRFTAPGYTPAVSRSFHSDAGRVEYSVALEPAEPLDGRVLASDGKPAPGASVIIIAKTSGSFVTLKGTAFDHWQGEQFSTDQNGYFHYMRPPGDVVFLATQADGGFGVLADGPNDPGARIVLQKWAHFEGRWLNDGQPVPGMQAALWIRARPDLLIALGTATLGPDGRFIYPTIPPGDLSVQCFGDRSGFDLDEEDIQPGEQKRQDWSTHFRKVTGKVQVRGSTPDRTAEYGIGLAPQQTIQMNRPEGLVTSAQLEQWQHDWDRTEAGRAYAALERNARNLRVQPDGTFESDWVAPGKYWAEGGLQKGPQRLAQLKIQAVEVLPGTTTQDLGMFTLDPVDSPFLQLGSLAPDFSVPDFDHGAVALAKLRGKYVLLDFWATDCPPCVAETPNLRDANERFAQDARFALVSMDIDQKAETAHKFIQANKMSWLQGYLPGGWENPVAKSYGIWAIPEIILLGPDGRVIARDLRGGDIADTIEKYLPKR